MTRCAGTVLGVVVLLLSDPGPVRAGMPSVTLADIPRAVRTGVTDLARQRLEVISFFLVGLLACAGVIQWIWNGLRRDFAVLPRLSYGRALGIIVLWGLLFVLVLTMISGARELMTPGAWEKKGLTYKLVQTPPPAVEGEITARFDAFSRLRDRLVEYARSHDGAFPTPAQAGEIPEEFWRLPPPSRGRFVYVGRQMGADGSPARQYLLAYEPEIIGPDRLVLLAPGDVLWMPATEIERVLKSEGL